VDLSGSDCFHLVLDAHARRNQAGGNVMRIALFFDDSLALDQVSALLARSPVALWLSNIRLCQGLFWSRPYWRYENKEKSVVVLEQEGKEYPVVPEAVLARGISLTAERFLEADLIRYPGGQSALILSWNHILMDGRGIAMFLQHLQELHAGLAARPISSFFPGPEIRHSLRSQIRNMYMVKAFIEDSSKPPVASIAGGSAQIRAGSANRILWFSREETGLIAENARLQGARFGPNLFYIASCAQAVKQLVQKREGKGDFWLPVPYDGRLRGAFGPLVSNTVAYLFYRLSEEQLLDTGSTVRAIFTQMHNQIRADMPRKYARLLDLMRHIPLRLYYYLVARRAQGNLSSFLYSATGDSFSAADSFFGKRIAALTIFPSATVPPGLTFSFLLHRDALNVNISYARDIVDTFELDRLVQHLKKLLLEQQA